MPEINENTATVAEPIVKTGSSSDPTSFDDLDALTTGSKDFKPHSDDVPKAKSQKERKDNEHEDEKPAKKAEPKEDDQDQKKVESKGEKKEADADAPKVKTVKFKNGDADLEVPAEAKVTVKVNGKDEIVDVQTLVNEYSGKTNWGRKYQELDTERKTFQAERQELQSGIDELFDLAVTQNKPMDAVQLLSDMLGGDGIKTVTELRQKMFKAFEEEMKLTPEQREIRKAQEERDLLKAKLSRQNALDAKKSEQTSLAKRVDEIKTKYGMDDARFSEIYQTLKKAGNVKPEELTPELIGQVHERWTQMDQVDEVVAELALEGESATSAKNALLKEWAIDKSLTKAQVKAIAAQVFGGKKQGSKLADKIKRNGQAHGAPVNTAKTKHEPITFDDLE